MILFYVPNLKRGLEHMLGLLENFVRANKLRVNKNKTKVMCMGTASENGSVMLEGVQLE